MSSVDDLTPNVPNVPNVPNATYDCHENGFYTSYENASYVAMVLSFSALGIIVALIAVVAVFVRMLWQLENVTRQLQAESLSDVRGGLFRGEVLDDPENRSDRKSKSDKRDFEMHEL